MRPRVPVLAPPSRGTADLALHVAWTDPAASALIGWVRRCRAQGLRVHVDVVCPAAAWQHVVAALCASSLAPQLPAASAVPGAADLPTPDELCRQLHLSGAGARVVRRARWGSLRFDGSLPVARQPDRRAARRRA